MDLRGAITALVTPFRGGVIDFKCLDSLVKWQIESGIKGLVISGTTGEAPTLSLDEKLLLLEHVNRVVCGRVPVVMGVTSNNTQETIRWIKLFKDADAFLIAAPYYNKPSQEGIYQHYKAVFEEVGKPVVVYDIPGRSAVSMMLDTLLRVLALPNVIALKDSTGDLTRPMTLRISGLHPEVMLLSGDDVTALPYNVHGGVGCISVTANLFPAKCSEMHDLCLSGNFASAMSINNALYAVHQAMFFDTNPISVKYALSLIMDDFLPDVRLPLVCSSGQVQQKIKAALLGYLENRAVA